MNFGRLFLPITAFLVVIGIERAAQADLILDFSSDGSASGLTVSPGGTIEIPIFLRQVGAGPFAPDITSDGLIGFGVQVDLTATPGSSTATAFSISSPFIDLTGSSSLGASSLQLFGDNLGGVTGSAIELARVTVLGNVEGNITTVTLSDPNPGATQDFGTLLFGPTDSQVFATTATISVTTVPEPSASLLLAMLSIVPLVSRRR